MRRGTGGFVVLLAIVLILGGEAFATETKTQYGTGLMITGYCQVQSISMYAPTIGDAAMIYDGLTAADAGRKFELSISAATSNAHWNAKGAAFRNGLYIQATDTDVMVAVVFDY